MHDFTNDELNPGYAPTPCAHKTCDLTGADSELTKCIVCDLRFCELCISEIGEEHYCLDCGVCACGTPAIVCCDVCLALVCGDHLRKHPLKTECRTCNPRADHQAAA